MGPLNPLLEKMDSRRESWEAGPSSFWKNSPVIFQYLWSTHTMWSTASWDILCCQEDAGDSRDGKWTGGFMRTEFGGGHLRLGFNNKRYSHPSRPHLGSMAPSLAVNMQADIPGSQRFFTRERSKVRVQKWDGFLSQWEEQGPRTKVGWVEQKATPMFYRTWQGERITIPLMVCLSNRLMWVPSATPLRKGYHSEVRTTLFMGRWYPTLEKSMSQLLLL